MSDVKMLELHLKIDVLKLKCSENKYYNGLSCYPVRYSRLKEMVP